MTTTTDELRAERAQLLSQVASLDAALSERLSPYAVLGLGPSACTVLEALMQRVAVSNAYLDTLHPNSLRDVELGRASSNLTRVKIYEIRKALEQRHCPARIRARRRFGYSISPHDKRLIRELVNNLNMGRV